ncbi:MAG: 4a-hydroxytetrahydrobiopterin dehydratase [Candidatus Hydrogenedentota bacterium]
MQQTLEELALQDCVPCEGGVPALEGPELAALMRKLAAPWELVEEHHLEREYTFDGYAPAVDFMNAVAHIAQKQNHHPDIGLTYGKVKITVWTHKADGLTLNDFVFAAKVEKLSQEGAYC